jgi:hypothetical protein
MTKRMLLALLLCLVASPAWAGMYLGDFPTSATVRCFYNTNAQTGASITRSTDGTLKIYKAGSVTERTSLTGITQTEDFDAATGVHLISIDTSDNTDAGFFAAGGEYDVVNTGMVIDTLTVNAHLCSFSLQRTGGILASILARLPNATPGAAGGVAIAGSNAATTFAALTVTAATTLTGNVVLSDGLTISAPSTTNRAGLTVSGNGTGAGISATSGTGATGNGITAIAASTNGVGISAAGVGTGAGILSTGGATGHGASLLGGATSGNGLNAAAATSGTGITATGVGTTKAGIAAAGGATTSAGISATGGATSGDGILAVAATSGIGVVATGAGTTKAGIAATGGATSSAGVLIIGGGSGAGMDINAGATGKGVAIATTAGDGLSILPTAGNAIVATANGTSKHGAVITGGTAGTSDGLKLAAGSGGVDMRANITGSLSGSVGSVASTAGGVTLMAVDALVKGSTSIIYEVILRDATTGAGLTGITSGSAGLGMSYCRADQGNAACTAITPAASTLGAYTSGCLKEKDATTAPGLYEFCPPNASIATGADLVTFYISGVSGMIPTILPMALVTTGLDTISSKIGTPAGASIAADIAADKTVDDAIKAKTDLLGFTGSNVNAITNAYLAGQAPLQPTTAGRTLLVAAAGGAAVDWANVQAPTTTVGLSGTTVGTVTTTTTATTATTCTNLTNAPTAGDFTATMKTSATTACTAATPTISTLGASTITAASIATDAITAAKVAADVGAEITSNPAGTYRKNIASQRKHPVLMRTAAAPQTGLTGATVAITVSKDGGAAGAVTGSVAELGLGIYFYTPSQADTNCDTCVYNATTALGVPFIFYIFTTN